MLDQGAGLCKVVTMYSQMPGSKDMLLGVVYEQHFSGLDTEPLKCNPKDLSIRFGHPDLP